MTLPESTLTDVLTPRPGEADLAAAAPLDLLRPDYRLDDALWADAGTVFLTGTQALVRLLRMQRAR